MLEAGPETYDGSRLLSGVTMPRTEIRYHHQGNAAPWQDDNIFRWALSRESK